MIKTRISKQLSANNQYSKKKLVDFLKNLPDNPYYYSDNEINPLIENLIKDWDVDFCMIESHSKFEEIIIELFDIDFDNHMEEFSSKDESKKLFSIFCKIQDIHISYLRHDVLKKKKLNDTWEKEIKNFYKSLFKKIQKIEKTIFTVNLSSGENATVTIYKPAVFFVKLPRKEYKDYLFRYEYNFQNFSLLGDKYFEIHDKPFILFFETDIQMEGYEQQIRKSFLMLFDSELLKIRNIIKYRFPFID